MWLTPSNRANRVLRDLRRAALAASMALIGLAVSAGASNAPSSVAVGARPPALAKAAALGAVAPRTRLALTVVLKSRDPVGLAALVSAVSTPGSTSYQHYLSVGEFAARFGADPAGVATLRRALRTEGLRPGALAANGLSIPVSATAAQASHAFDVSLRSYRTHSGVRLYANTAAPRMPAALGNVVQDVLGLDDVPQAQPQGLVRAQLKSAPRGAAKARAHTAAAPSFPNGAGPAPCQGASGFEALHSNVYTIDQIAKAYGMDDLYADGDFGQGVTVALLELDTYASSADEPTDLAAFQQCYGTNAQITIEPLVDGGGTKTATAESAVDLQNLIGLAPEANVDLYEGPNTLMGRYDTLARIVAADNAQVITDSWGECEQEDVSAAESEKTLLEEAAAQGESFLASTGDRGAEGCASEWNNNLNNITQQGDPNAPLLAVDDPASQPLATAVGGTNLNAAGPPPSETAWNRVFWGASGGGISTLWAMPAYQIDAGVPGVLNSYSSGAPCGQTSGYCREVPDVSADGSTETAYVTYFQGAWTAFGGTSTTAPVWAALSALADSALAGDSSVSGCTAGPPLGFLNPLLYEIAAGDEHADAFNDVTVGNNSGYFNGTVPYGDYPATPGYDMVTGLGTPIADNGSSTGLVPQLCAASATPLGAAPVVSGLQGGEASAGSTVTVDGSGFTRYTAVWFGGAVASAVTDMSPTQLVATVPPGAGAVDVRVTGLAGASPPNAADVFSYAPTETIGSPQSGATYTMGQRVIASYSCAASVAGATSCTAPVANGAAINTSTAGAHQFAVTTTDANGFSTTTIATYSVVAAPTIAIAAPAPGGVYARAQSLTAAFSCAASAPATITSCTGPVAAGAPVATTAPGPHSFTVTATDSNGVNSALTAGYTIVAVRPTISGLHETAARWLERTARGLRLPLGTTFSFSLDQAARVVLSFARLTDGRKADGRCVSPALAGPRAQRCTRSRSAGTLTIRAQTGGNALAFSGKTSLGRLPAGTYSVALSATGLTGRPSAPVSLRFTIAAATR
jgi:subtilase family serine protease